MKTADEQKNKKANENVNGNWHLAYTHTNTDKGTVVILNIRRLMIGFHFNTTNAFKSNNSKLVKYNVNGILI